MKAEKKLKKSYVKPSMVKKKSVAVISGSESSGSGCGCNYYVSRVCTAGNDVSYYH